MPTQTATLTGTDPSGSTVTCEDKFFTTYGADAALNIVDKPLRFVTACDATSDPAYDDTVVAIFGDSHGKVPAQCADELYASGSPAAVIFAPLRGYRPGRYYLGDGWSGIDTTAAAWRNTKIVIEPYHEGCLFENTFQAPPGRRWLDYTFVPDSNLANLQISLTSDGATPNMWATVGQSPFPILVMVILTTFAMLIAAVAGHRLHDFHKFTKGKTSTLPSKATKAILALEIGINLYRALLFCYDPFFVFGVVSAGFYESTFVMLEPLTLASTVIAGYLLMLVIFKGRVPKDKTWINKAFLGLLIFSVLMATGLGLALSYRFLTYTNPQSRFAPLVVQLCYGTIQLFGAAVYIAMSIYLVLYLRKSQIKSQHILDKAKDKATTTVAPDNNNNNNNNVTEGDHDHDDDDAEATESTNETTNETSNETSSHPTDGQTSGYETSDSTLSTSLSTGPVNTARMALSSTASGDLSELGSASRRTRVANKLKINRSTKAEKQQQKLAKRLRREERKRKKLQRHQRLTIMLGCCGLFMLIVVFMYVRPVLLETFPAAGAIISTQATRWFFGLVVSLFKILAFKTHGRLCAKPEEPQGTAWRPPAFRRKSRAKSLSSINVRMQALANGDDKRCTVVFESEPEEDVDIDAAGVSTHDGAPAVGDGDGDDDDDDNYDVGAFPEDDDSTTDTDDEETVSSHNDSMA